VPAIRVTRRCAPLAALAATLALLGTMEPAASTAAPSTPGAQASAATRPAVGTHGRSATRRTAARSARRTSASALLARGTGGRAHAPDPLRAGAVPGRAPLTGGPAMTEPGATAGASLPEVFGTLADQSDPAQPATTADAGSTPATAPAPATLGVRVSETPTYRATLSRIAVAAGAVRIQLQNEGEDDHDLRITRIDDTAVAGYLSLTSPGRTRSTTLTLDPGTYRLACTLQAPVNHADAGMRSTLTVTS